MSSWNRANFASSSSERSALESFGRLSAASSDMSQ